MKAALREVDRTTYRPHSLHAEDRAWPETNCYVDLWVELLHSLGLEPLACMAFTLALDYEGDQFTFFKFPLEDLEQTFGAETMELQPWKPLPEAIFTQLARGRSVIVELDSFYLPDTAGVSYRLEHVKTSVAVNDLDLEQRRLGYFHNRGYYQLDGEDYARVFHLDAPRDPQILPPYFEVVKLDRLRRPDQRELQRLGREQLRRHLARRPKQNPLRAFAADFPRDVDWLRGQPLQSFHPYAFATVRQLGANFECAASFLRWLLEADGPAAQAFERIANTAKAMQFRLARVAHTKKTYDAQAALQGLAADWDAGMSALGTA